LTSAAFSRNCCTKKLFFSSTFPRTLPTLPCGRVSQQKSPFRRSGGWGRRSNGTLACPSKAYIRIPQIYTAEIARILLEFTVDFLAKMEYTSM
jgi:hypothetical protein